jgi:hypothetical protein
MSGWIITRTVNTVTRYRASTGHLTADRARAEVFPSADAALPHAQEGDVIEQANGFKQ